ncbi:DUF5107 domain-containing protein [Flavihumibacter petaseus]|uniref:DUF5107 domain-containing protein n=1 Tax=Flavihumibacter petaseus NBRC 106054 TaxID=1220578 RepID=A0A0E9MX40_9BACT|nr:DUF5107 domain-containing protein [Flavihumibacter petaseus]GAO42154.1 hypothetical protein FPE01S_01_11670 [Flavihumibacter petaseus NBRC 106054]
MLQQIRLRIIGIVTTAAILTAAVVHAQQPALFREYEKEYTTYPFSDPNPVPLLTPVYPYFRFDGFTTTPVQQKWKVVELENDYIRLLILPQIGGKIWTAIDKKTNRPFLYDNKVIKFRDIAMRGPWTSGGLEANFGIIGHTPNCATPVDYTVVKQADGSVSCYIGVLELLSRSYWRMEIRLPKDQAAFQTRTFWYNASALDQPYYHWMNAGLPAGNDLEFIYPGTKFLGHDGESSEWPVKDNGKKISWYKENNFGGYKSYHVFGKYAEFSGAYWHDTGEGMVRFGSRDDKAGTKIWIWGLSRQGMIWEKMLTDRDGQYVELQSGRMFNQNSEKSSLTPFKHIGFAPFATDSWSETWYPVSQTGGMVKADASGALNLNRKDGRVVFTYYAVKEISDTIELTEGNSTRYRKAIHLQPSQVFTDSVTINGNAGNLTWKLLNSNFTYDEDPKSDNLSRPVHTPADFNWNTAYGQLVSGTEAMAMKQFDRAEKAFAAALAIDSNYLPALVKYAELAYRSMRYDRALHFARRALAIDTHDGAANYFYALSNAATGNQVDAADGFALATLDPAYRSAAYTELSRLFWKQHAAVKAIVYAAKALEAQPRNIEALQLLVFMQHRAPAAVATSADHSVGTPAQAIETIRLLDPLNHFTAMEAWLQQPNAANRDKLNTVIRNELPAESYLEKAIWYAGLQDTVAALKLLSVSPVNSEVILWQDALTHKKTDPAKADLRFSFPFRPETYALLTRLRNQQDHWKWQYLQALLLQAANRSQEALSLLQATGDTPDFAPLYAYRAALAAQVQPGAPGIPADLQRAFSLDSSWRYRKALIAWYNDNGQPQIALPLAASYAKSHPADYIMGMLYAKTLLLNRQYAASDAVLTKLNIIPFEGATEGREMYREAKLMQAISAIQQKQYRKAAGFISAAKIWPENLGVGKPYDQDIDLRLENWLSYDLSARSGKPDLRYLEAIVAFEPKVDNTVRNFIPSNAAVNEWTRKELQRLAGTSGSTAKAASTLLASAGRDGAAEPHTATGTASPTADSNQRIIDAVGALR